VTQRPRLVVVALAVTAALMTPTAAHAEKWSASDAEADVRGSRVDPEPPPCGTYTDVDASANTNQDVSRVVVSHLRREVKVVVRFRDLVRDLEQHVSVHLTAGKRRWVLDVDRFRDFDADVFQVSAFLARGPFFTASGEDCGEAVVIKPTRCHVRPSLDLHTSTLRAVVPRSCLRSPRWVRVGVRATGTDAVDPSVGYSDEWGSSASRLPPWSPRVPAPRGAPVGGAGPTKLMSPARGAAVVPGRGGLHLR
jgi:hypothetical protein